MKLSTVSSPAPRATASLTSPARAKSGSVVGLAVGAALGLALLTGCGTGQITQTSTEQSAVNGYQGTAGDVAVRNATIAYAGKGNGPVYRAGQSAQLNLTLVNTGATADKLVSVSSPWAASVQVQQGDGTIPAGRAVQVGNGDSGADAAALADRTISITLTGIKGDMTAGPNYPVIFTFQRGGVLNAQLPIGYPTGQQGVRN